LAGGAGSAVLEYKSLKAWGIDVLCLGLPDRFVDHGDHKALLAECGLSASGIQASIEARVTPSSVITPTAVVV